MSFLSTLGHALSSKTVWAGIGGGLLAVAQFIPTIAQYVPAGTPVGGGLAIAMAALTIYGRIRAKQPLGPVIDTTIQQTVDAVHEIQGQAPPSVAKVDAVTAMVKNQTPPPPSSGGPLHA